MAQPLNKYSQRITQPKSQGASQAQMYAFGFKDEDFSKAQVGISSVWYEGNNCNMHLLDLAEKVKEGVEAAGLKGLRFNTVGVSDGMSMGTEGMSYSLQSRDLIADSIETVTCAQWYDANISIPGCDKNMPGCLMAMGRINRPSLMVYGGSIRPGYVGKEVVDIVSAFQSYGQFIAGGISEEERAEIVRNACPGPGGCGGMYTANTMATAIEALKQTGVSDPGRQLVMIRSWNTSTLLVKNEAFSSRDIDVLKAFCRERWFDLVFYPGMTIDEANRYNQLQEAWYYEAAGRLLGPASANFMDNYKFNIHPATDNRPYFSRFLKWKTLPELLTLRNRGGMPLLEWGYLILIATLVLAVLASLLLVLLPLWLRRRIKPCTDGSRWRFPAYFAAIGTAFMFVEIAFIQKFILFLHHPLYAVSVVLCAFLVFAGMGSLLSARWYKKLSLLKIASGIAVFSVLYMFLLPGLFNWLVQIPGEFKIPVSVFLIAPLAFLMGMPFPLGLSLVSHRCPSWIPWAWGINGCASVISAILATLLAIHFGFVFVVFVAVLLYLLAAMLLREKPRF